MSRSTSASTSTSASLSSHHRPTSLSTSASSSSSSSSAHRQVKSQLLSVLLLRHKGSQQDPIRIGTATDLSKFNILKRGTIKEYILFASTLAAQRTFAGSRQTITLQDYPFVAHTQVRTDGLSCVVITDEKYEPRVAFSLTQQCISKYHETWDPHKEVKTKASFQTKEGTPIPELDNWLLTQLHKYSNPYEADQFLKVEGQIADIKGIMQVNLEQILERGEKLDDLAQKSEILSKAAKTFLKDSKKVNRCCRF